MIHNAMREVGSADGFLGHLSASQFILVVSASTLPALSERIISRLEQSLDYFYPIRDRDAAINWHNRLAIKIAQIPSSCVGAFNSPEELKAELLRLKK
jgi:hypothetical protein